MKANEFTKEQVIEIGKKLAENGFVAKFRKGSRSHDVFALFPQTEPQYKWLKKEVGTTYNVCIIHTKDEVLAVLPELKEVVKPTKSGRFCRIDITL